MEEKVKLFNEKRQQIKHAIHSINSNYMNDKDIKALTPATQKEIRAIIKNLNWINHNLDGVNFSLDKTEVNQENIEIYLEIAEHTLNFIHDNTKNFKKYYESSLNDGASSLLSILNSSLDVFVLIGKIAAFATLFLAATPTIIVTTLPAFFAVAVNLITPLLVLLPALTIATGAIGLLLVGLKITQVALSQHTSLAALVTQTPQQRVRHKAAEKLLENSQLCKGEKAPLFKGLFHIDTHHEIDNEDMPSKQHFSHQH